MQLAMVGLGRMGLNMARRLARGGHRVVAYNRSIEKARDFAEQENGGWAGDLPELVAKIKPPRVVWLMLPAGAVEVHIKELSGLLSAGDVIIEGGNSHYKDDLRRAEDLETLGIEYLDAGVSGGIWGLENGYCLMVGGPKGAYERLGPVWKTLAPKEGCLHTGPTGSGHFVKMIHNAIEYGMMQAYAEGFELMAEGPYVDHHDFEAVSHLWMQGSVVRSWLLELIEQAFKEDPGLDSLSGYVDDSGEGRWAVMQAVESATPAPVITMSLMNRFRSRQNDSFSGKVLAAMRKRFGGHEVKKSAS